MPRTSMSLMVSAACALTLVAGSVFAQPAGGGAGGGAGTRQPGGGGGGGVGGRGMGGGMMFGGMGGGMMGGMDGQSISSADLDKYGKILDLSPEQHDAVKALHEGYTAEVAKLRERAQKMMEDAREEFRETRDPAIWQEIGEKITPIREEGKKIEKQFLEDMKSLLTDKQAPLWGRVEKTRKREQTIRRGFISGETVDVIRVVERMNLPEEQMKTINPTLERYENDLDPVLTKRNELFEAGMSQMRTLMQDVMQGKTEEADKRMSEARDASVRVRDVNRRYAKEIASLLPPESSAKFDEEFKRESFPRIYRQSRYAQTVIDSAMKMEGVDETQRKSIEAIAETYKRDTQTLNKKAEEATEASESTMTVSGMMTRMGGDDPAMSELRRSRTELENKTIEAVKALLTESQRAQLPERGREGRGGGGGGEGTPGMDRGNGGGGGNDGQPQRRRPRGNNNNNGGGGNG